MMRARDSFKLVMKPMAELNIQTVGSSLYSGDIHKDLASGRVQKATMTEIVVSENHVANAAG